MARILGKNHTFKTGTDAEKPNFYALDMFLIRLVRACTLVTLRAIRRRTFSAVTSVPKVTTFFTQWVGMPLVCQLSNTLWIQAMTQLTLRRKILPTSNVRLTPLAFLTTGTARLIRLTLTTTSGLSGFSPNCMKRPSL